MNLEHLSYSSINLFCQCPEHWRRKYVLGEPMPTTAPLLFGSAFHDTIETYIRDKSVDIKTVWAEKYNAALEADPFVEWGKSRPETLYNDGYRMFSDEDILSTVEGLVPLVDEFGPMIERKVTLYAPDVPVPIIGYIDMVAADGTPCDFKTSARTWTTTRAASETQPLFYLAALNALGHRSKNFRHIVFVKTKTPQVQIIETPHTTSEIFWLFDMVRRVWDAIETGVFPMNPNGWLCAEGMCPFWPTCRGKGVNGGNASAGSALSGGGKDASARGVGSGVL